MKQAFIFLILCSSCINSSHTGPQAEQLKDIAIENFGRSFARSNDLKLIIVGDTTDAAKYKTYGLSFMSQKRLSLQEGRDISVALVGDLLKTAQKDHDVQSYVRWAASDSPSTAQETEPTLYTVGIKISFWTESMERQKPPYLAEICFYDDTFHFYERDPDTEVLHLVAKESFEEAFSRSSQ